MRNDTTMQSRDSFLGEEIRCEFLVTQDRKKLWKVLLDVFEEFIRICDKHKIRYYIDGGTLLGAIRHNGFIPWDDDIDVAVFRDDYEKLQAILPKELPSHLFMQTTLTDSEYDIAHLKIRDSRTTALELNHVREGRKYNMGIFFDVFPIDAVPKNALERFYKLRVMKLIKIVYVLSLRRKHSTLKSKVGGVVCKIIRRVLGEKLMYRLRENVYASTNFTEDGNAAVGISEFGISDYLYRNKKWYEKSVIVPFEYLNVRAPANWRAFLEHVFGDWKTPRQGGALHSDIIFDMDRDYKTVLKEKYAEFGY